MEFEFYTANAIVAVGMNGDMVILSVSSESNALTMDARELPADVALSCSSTPSLPGIYEFKGSSCREILDENTPVIIHRGNLELVSAFS